MRAIFNRRDNKQSSSGKANPTRSQYNNFRNNNRRYTKGLKTFGNIYGREVMDFDSTDIGNDIKSVKKDINNIKSSYRNSKATLTDSNDDIKKLAKQSLKDLRHGKLYSKEREDEAKRISNKIGGMESMTDEDGFDFDDDGDSMDFDLDDDFSDLDIDSNDDKPTAKAKSSKVTTRNNNVLIKNQVIDNGGLSVNDVHIINGRISLGTEAVVRLNSDGFGKVISALSTVTSGEDSGREVMLSGLAQLNDSLSFISSQQADTKKLKATKGSTLTDLLLGNFSIGNIASEASSNMEFIENMVAPMIAGGLAEFAANPFGKALQGGITMLIKRMDTENRIGQLNQNVRDMPLILRSMLEDGVLDSESNPLGKLRNSTLGKRLLGEGSVSEKVLKGVFGSKFSLKEIDTSNRLAKNAQVSYDGESHNSLNIVIPGYLMEIEKATGGQERYYDYYSGQWKGRTASQHRIDNMRANYSNQKNVRLKATLKKGGVSDNNIDDVIVTLTNNQIKNVEQLRSLRHKFSSETAYLQAEKAITENPDEYRKHLKLSQLYMGFHSKFMTDVSGSEMNLYNRDWDSVSEREQVELKAHDKLKGSLSAHRKKIEEMAEAMRTRPTEYRPQSDEVLGNAQVSGLNVGSIQDITVKAEGIFNTVKDISENGFNPTVLVSGIADMINTKKSKEDTDPVNITTPSMSKSKIFQNKLDEGLTERSKDEAKSDKVDLNAHGISDRENRVNLSKLTDMLGGLGGDDDDGIMGSGIIQTLFDGLGLLTGPIGAVLGKSKMGAKLLTATKSVTGMLKGTSMAALKNPMGMVKTIGPTVGKLVSKVGLGKIGTKGITKMGSKVMGKIAAKTATKAGGKALASLIPGIGTAVFVATSFPEIMQTLKHPIESLKHPLKTLGSFFGLTEHPGKTYEKTTRKEDRTTISSIAKKLDPVNAILNLLTDEKSKLGLAFSGTIIGKLLRRLQGKGQVETSVFGNNHDHINLDRDNDISPEDLQIQQANLSPLGVFAGVNNRIIDEYLNSEVMTDAVKNPQKAAKALFSNTAVGGIYSLTEEGGRGSWFSNLFSKLFGGLGGSGSDTASPYTPSTNTPSESTPPADRMAGVSASLSQTQPKVDSVKSPSVSTSGSKGISGSIGGSTSKTPTGKINKLVSGLTSNSKKGKSNGAGSTAPTGSVKEIINNYYEPMLQDMSKIFSGYSDRYKENIAKITNDMISNDGSVKHNVIGDKLDKDKVETSVESKSMVDYDFEQYLIMRDLLNVMNDIDKDTFSIVTHLTTMEEEIKQVNSTYEHSNQKRELGNSILNQLNLAK